MRKMPIILTEKRTTPGARPIYYTSIGNLTFTVAVTRDSSWGKYMVSVVDKRVERIRPHRCSETVGQFKNLIESRAAIREYAENHTYAEDSKSESTPVTALPAADAPDFYPTPSALAGRMLAKVDWNDVSEILEPSAGKGDLVDNVCRFVHSREDWSKTCRNQRMFYRADLRDNPVEAFDTIESDMNLRLLLKGKGLRVVSDDFLSYRTEKRYDLIIMNPPFSNGAAHLLHAIEMQKNGGQIVSLLNAETLRNPYTKERQLLVKLLQDYSASVEFIQGAFERAERKSSVEVALVYINIPAKAESGYDFFKNLKSASPDDFTPESEPNKLVFSNEILSLIQHYDAEAKAAKNFFKAYNGMLPYMLSCKSSEYSSPLFTISIGGKSVDSVRDGVSKSDYRKFMRLLRREYWRVLLDKPSVNARMTSAMKESYNDKLREMEKYEFSEFNVMQVFYDIQLQLIQGVEDSIISLFDKLTAEYSYFSETCGNIHYYNGWKTNKAHKVGKKVILPLNGYSSYSWRKGELDPYAIVPVISDLERALSFLDKGDAVIKVDPTYIVNRAITCGQTVADFTYFNAKFYKKGTVHLTFNESAMPVVERLNIFAARQRGWLPPDYGKKAYSDLDAEQREVVDSFQGEAKYNEVMKDPSNFILDANTVGVLLPGCTEGR